MSTTDGHTLHLVIAVPEGDGDVFASVGGDGLTFEPEQISRVVRILRLAQAQALQDRGTW